MNTLKHGLDAERRAEEFLKLNGVQILKRNLRSRFGEIDIIGRQNGIICFCEVKMRRHDALAMPREWVSVSKRRKIGLTAKVFAAHATQYSSSAFRFDVVEIIEGKNWRQYCWIEDAFRLDE